MATTQNPKIRLSLDITPEANELIEKMAEDLGTSKADVMRKAIAVMKVAVDAKKDHKHLGVSTKRENLETEIVGI
jgi:hypothetical protein